MRSRCRERPWWLLVTILKARSLLSCITPAPLLRQRIQRLLNLRLNLRQRVMFNRNGTKTGTTGWDTVSATPSVSVSILLTRLSGTWNSLGQGLTEDRVLKALGTLAENKISISNLIIDDNWQDIDYRGDGQWQHGWNDFEAEPKTFPRGLKALVSDIRSKHKNIQHIAVWHALGGYWAGLAPSGPLAKRYKTIQVTRDATDIDEGPADGQMTLVAQEDVQAFYNDFYRFLSDAGIDGVKTDGQYMIDTWSSPNARRTLTQPYLDAWGLATLRHFSGRAISCMSQAPSIIFRMSNPTLFLTYWGSIRKGQLTPLKPDSQLPTARPPVVVRNSDDYYPPNPEAQPWHIFCNAHNALFNQHRTSDPSCLCPLSAVSAAI